MIKPDKFTNPFNCVVYNSYIILNILKEKKQIKSKKLHQTYIKKLGKDSDPLFVLSLDFLFLLGLIDYNTETDFLEFINEIE